MKEGWETKRLGDVCVIDKQQGAHATLPYVGLEHIESHTGRFLGSKTPLQVKSSTFRFSPEHVLYGRLRPYLNKVLLPDFEGHCSTEIFPLKPNHTLRREFLQYWLMADATVDAINATSTGARMPRANITAVLDFAVPLPPLSEQHRIVAKLDEAFACIDKAKENADKNVANARAIFDSELNAIVTKKGVEWERITLHSLLERGWIESHLDGNHGGDYPRKNEFIKAGVPYISAKCIENDDLRWENAKFLSAGRAARLRKGVAKDNDVLFAHNATVGPVTILHTKEEKVILGTSLTYYRCNDKYILPDYLAHYMRSYYFRKQYLQVMKQSTRNQVPITKQREFVHVIPPLADQKKIVSALNGFRTYGKQLQSVYQRKLNKLEDLKKSLLHHAFTGQL
jgi:type I restriction enzyme S subunit